VSIVRCGDWACLCRDETGSGLSEAYCADRTKTIAGTWALYLIPVAICYLFLVCCIGSPIKVNRFRKDKKEFIMHQNRLRAEEVLAEMEEAAGGDIRDNDNGVNLRGEEIGNNNNGSVLVPVASPIDDPPPRHSQDEGSQDFQQILQSLSPVD